MTSKITDVKKIWGYSRISTDTSKQLFSLENQKQLIEGYAKSLNIPCEVYFDEISGAKEIKKRTSLKFILDHIGKHDMIVVNSLDRLSRSLQQILDIIQKAKKEGWLIHIITLNLTIPSDMISNFIISIFGQFAELEREIISSRVKASWQHRKKNNIAKRRHWWESGKSELECYKREQLIKNIKKHWDDGKEYKEIAHLINEMGLRTHRNNLFYSNTIRLIVNHLIQTGELKKHNFV
jgi:DNA invertase Pin-like site-specific DNA recombinase